MKKLLPLALLIWIGQSPAITVELPANKDNTLYETNTLALSNGAGDYFFVGLTLQASNTIRRGLVQFDLSGIPANSVINQAYLEITASRSRGGSQQINLHRATQDWGEAGSHAPGQEGGGTAALTGDATWTNAFHEGASWAVAGGDFEALPSGSVVVNSLSTFAITGLEDDIRHWLDNPAGNFGWVIIGDENNAGSAYRFNTRENASNQPKLVIEYQPLLTNQYTPAKDNTLYEDPLGSVSNGAGDRIFMGQIQNGDKRRGVLEFDLTDIPPYAEIQSVTLDLVTVDVPGSAVNASANLHLALAEWGAAGSSGSGQGASSQTGDATWIHTFFDTDNWTTAGGDFSPVASATAGFTTTVGETISFASTTELIADVTLWIQNPADNHGWVLLGDEVNNGNARSVSSADAATNQPVLTIEYTIPDLIFENGFDD